MPVAQFTVTAKTGPASQVTSQVFTKVTAINFDFEKSVMTLCLGSDSAPYREFDLTGVTVITDTITAGLHVLVLS